MELLISYNLVGLRVLCSPTLQLISSLSVTLSLFDILPNHSSAESSLPFSFLMLSSSEHLHSLFHACLYHIPCVILSSYNTQYACNRIIFLQRSHKIVHDSCVPIGGFSSRVLSLAVCIYIFCLFPILHTALTRISDLALFLRHLIFAGIWLLILMAFHWHLTSMIMYDIMH